MVMRLSNRPVPDMLRDVLVALAPGLCHLLAGWVILG